jgi:osmotically-inducible protein OsmY
MNSDRKLQLDVLDELRWEPGVDAADIGVSVKDGVVTLEGTVDNFAEKWAAEEAVKRLPGVKALAMDVVVELPGSTERNDTDIARAAENALEWNTSVPQDRIKVTADNHFLTLEGEVDWDYQRSAAEQAVRYLTGVRGVINEIAVRPNMAPAEIKEKIEAAFKRDALLSESQIKVRTDGGKVTLKGHVRSWAAREEAERNAWAAPGVFEVTNNIKVSH